MMCINNHHCVLCIHVVFIVAYSVRVCQKFHSRSYMFICNCVLAHWMVQHVSIQRKIVSCGDKVLMNQMIVKRNGSKQYVNWLWLYYRVHKLHNNI